MEGLQGYIDVGFYAIVGLLLAIAGFFFVIGVFQFMSAGGDQQKSQQGITSMRNSVIGAVLIGGAGLVINFIVLDIIRPGGGEAGTLGQGTSCDQRLRQVLQTSPVSVANSTNVHLVIKQIQADDECPASAWNPVVGSASGAQTSGFEVDGVSAPGTLFSQNDNRRAPKANPVRDARGNILITWNSSNQPQDRATHWMYTASSGSWWSE